MTNYLQIIADETTITNVLLVVIVLILLISNFRQK